MQFPCSSDQMHRTWAMDIDDVEAWIHPEQHRNDHHPECKEHNSA